MIRERTPGAIRVVGPTTLARGLGAGAGLALPLVLGRVLGAAGAGAFGFSLAVCLLCVLVARGGRDTALLRSVSRAMTENDAAAARRHARRAARGALAMAVVLTAAAWAWTFANPFGLLVPERRGLLLIMLPATPPAVLAWQLSGFFKGLGRPGRAVLLENGGAAALTLVAFAAALGVDPDVGAGTAGYAFLAANLGLAGGGLWLYRRWTRRAAAGPSDWPGPTDREASSSSSSSSRAFFLIDVSSYLTAAGSLAIAGLFLADADLGLLWAAERLALPIGFIFLVAAPILQPRIAAAFHRGRLDELASLAARARSICALAGLPAAALLFLFPRAFLSLAGPDFAAAAPLLRIMLIGQVARIAVGPLHHLLTMTRHERAMRNLSVTLLALSVGAYPALTAAFGPAGFATCHAAVTATHHLGVAALARRALGFWPGAGPSPDASGRRPAA